MRWLRVAAVLLVLVVMTAAAQEFKLRIDVAVVSLETVILDSNGRPVTNLRREDFTIRDDGVAQDIQNFLSVDTPYSILLLFQNTLSMVGQRPFMAEASNRFLDALRPQDRVSIFTTDATKQRILSWRNAATGKHENVFVRRPGKDLRLYENIDSVFGEFTNVSGRKGIIILTNGRDAQILADTIDKGRVPPAEKDNTFQKLLKKVRERGIPLYFVAFNTDRNLVDEIVMYSDLYGVKITNPPTGPMTLRGGAEYNFLQKTYVYSRDYLKHEDRSPTIADDFLIEVRSRLETLAEVSGGRIYFPLSLDDVAVLYEQIAKELGTSYSLAYTPNNAARDGKSHRIEVQVSSPNLRVVQSRQTYMSR